MILLRFLFVLILSVFSTYSQSWAQSSLCQIELSFNRSDILQANFLGSGTLECSNSVHFDLSAQIRLYEDQPSLAGIKKIQISSAPFQLQNHNEVFRQFSFNTDGNNHVLMHTNKKAEYQEIPLQRVYAEGFSEWQILQLLHYSQIELDQEFYDPNWD